MRFETIVLSAALLLPFPLQAQNNPAAAQPGTVPVTSQTPASQDGTTTAGTTATPPNAATGAHLSKSERKKERKAQKQAEKTAHNNAVAAKANESSIKAQDKAARAAQKASQP